MATSPQASHCFFTYFCPNHKKIFGFQIGFEKHLGKWEIAAILCETVTDVRQRRANRDITAEGKEVVVEWFRHEIEANPRLREAIFRECRESALCDCY